MLRSVLDWPHDLCVLWLGSNDIEANTNHFTAAHEVIEIAQAIESNCKSTVKSRIESFTDTDYPLTQFLDRLEHERQFLMEAKKIPVLHIPQKEEKPTVSPETKPPMSNSQFEKLQGQLETLSKKMSLMVKPPPTRYSCPKCRTNDHSRINCPSPYCPYCRNDSHSLANCTRKPPIGTCFDCRRPNCRRGRPGCPGRTETAL